MRILVKFGSAVLSDENQFVEIVREIYYLSLEHDVIIVTSGAIDAGKKKLLFMREPNKQEEQMLAAVGQPIIMIKYANELEQYERSPAQILVTQQDFESIVHRVNFKIQILLMLKEGIIPFINTNDPLSPEELNFLFSENDRLAVLCAKYLECNLIIFVTEEDGVLTCPREDGGMLIKDYNKRQCDIKFGQKTKQGKGNMSTKVDAACDASKNGIQAVICGFKPGNLMKISQGLPVGTLFSES